MIIGVFGISGVGKTTIVKNFLSFHKHIVGFSASQLIKTYGGVIDRKKITKNDAKLNQIILLDAVTRYQKENTKPLILEMHNIIEARNGIINIDNIFSSLIVDAACFIYKDPSIIATQRANDSEKERKNTPAADIELLQEKSLLLFERRFSKIKTLVIKNEHQRLFNEFMKNVLS